MKKPKRLLAAILALVILLGCIPTSINAATGTIYYDSSNIQYGTNFSFVNPYGDGFPGGTHNWNSSTTISYIHVNNGIGYCIQPGIRIGDGPGDKVTYIGGSSTTYYSKMSDDLQTAIELTKLYGYPNKIGNKNGYYATQVMIWGLIIGQVDPVDFTGTNKFYTCLNTDSKNSIKTYYDQLLNDLKNHYTIPSFSSKYASQAKTITLKWNSSNKRYEATVTDENGILSKFDFSASGVKFSKNGNDLTISSTSSITETKQASSEKDMPEVTVGSPNVWYSKASQWEQEVITGAAQPDPVKAYIKVKTEQPGAIALKKTSEDGVIAGVKFKISGNGVERTVVTGSDGSVKASDLPPGTYTVSEVEIPGYYETPESQTVKLTAGETASVSFSNTLKKGDLVVTKTAEDGLKQGFTFKLTGTSDSGEKINLTAVTGTDGKATFQNVPIGSGYVLSEVNTPDYYIVPANQTAAIEWNKVTNKSFVNNLKKGSLTVTKTSEDGLKKGFTFRLTGVSDSGQKVNLTATTDATGKATFKDVPIGSGYVLSEEGAPDWYVVPDDQEAAVEWNKVTNKEFYNALKKGSLTVTKTSENGLKEGFTFRLTGTADNGQSVNLTAKTDETGKATFKNVPIGSGYVLSEINTPDYYIVPANQTADIEWNKVTNKSFVNNLKKGGLVVVKTAEDGVKKGFTFRLTGTSDSGQKVDLTATTGEDGRAVFENVPIGSGYILSEIHTPGHYVVPADQEIAVEWNRVTGISVNNALKKGSLVVTKTSEDGMKQGFTFKLTGTADSGQKIELTAITGEDGRAVFQNVPIGSGYVLSEVGTPDWYIVPDDQEAAIEWNKVTNKSFVNNLKKGSLTVTKTAEDGLKEGFTFRLTGVSDSGQKVNLTATTDATGKATFKDVPIGSGYVLSEEGAPDWYVIPDDQEAAIEWNKVTNKEFYNALKKGTLTVTKTAEDGFKEGFTFRLTGTADNGDPVNLTAKTDSTGKATFKNVPIGSGYVLSEENTPDRYVVPKDQTGDIDWNKVTNQSVSNILKKFRVQLHKSDAETGTAQGDAVLDGAQYTLYNQQGEELETLIITNGTAVSGYYPCQTITIRETKAPVGYQLDDTVYTVEAPPEGQDIEHITLKQEVKEQVIKGKIAVLKFLEEADGNGDIKPPLEGIEFTITLNSDPSVKDVITTDENGYAETRLLPYGIYTVTETKPPESVTPIRPFTVNINQNNKVYRYILANDEKGSLVKIVKADAETGKTIPLAGAGFRIKDLTTGEWVKQHVNYPTPTEIDEFFTSSDGTLMLPTELPYGDYELYETVPPVGYLLYDKPIPFTIDGSQETVTVTCQDTAVKGEIQVEKIGERFTAVKQEKTEYGTQYTPIFTETGLPDVEFTITAAENIQAADGTVLMEEGQTAGVIVTGEDGKASLSDLPLGADGTARYLITEIGAPDDHLTAEPVEVTLSYKDGQTPVVTVSANIVDTRKKAQITLQKELETDEKFGIGAGEEYRNVVFGLFAEKDIFSPDGSQKLPAGSLIAYTGIDENGNAAFPADLPAGAYYVQEVSTDDHYILNGQKHPFTIDYADQDTETVVIDAGNGSTLENTLKRGRIFGWKVDQDGFELGGAVVGLFRRTETEFTEKTALMVTESNEIGYFAFCDVPYGSYLVREIESPEGFILTEESFPVEITEDGQAIEIVIQNQIIRGDVEVRKTNAEDTGQLLTGAVFGVYADIDGNGEYDSSIDRRMATLTESETGVYRLHNLAYGNYLLHEEQAPEGFVRDDGYYPFSITEDGKTITMETKPGEGFRNKPIRGNLEVRKTNSEDTEQLLTGAVFAVYADVNGNGQFDSSVDKLVGNLTETEAGVYRMEKLPYGNYLLHEEQAPKGFVRDDGYYPFSITEDGKTVTMETKPEEGFLNKPVRGNVEVHKTNGEDTKQLLTGAVFAVYADVNGNGQFDSSVDKLVGNLTETEAGVYRMEKLPYGKYLLHEEQAPEGFVQDDGYYSFSITEDGKTVTMETKPEEGFLNKPVRGNVEVHKTNGEDIKQLLTGAVFAVYADVNGNGQFDSSVDKLVGNLTETEAGVYRMEKLPYGKYLLHEEQAPEGFVQDDGYYSFSITEDGKTVTVETKPEEGFLNKPVRGNVEVHKTNGEDIKQLLTGAVFAVYADVDGNGQFDSSVDKLVGNLTETEAGVYRMEKLAYGKYLLHEEQAPEGFVQDDGYYSFSITEDGKTVTVETKPEEGFLNKPVRGNVEVQKTNSEDTKQLLTGAVFAVYTDANGNGSFDPDTDKLVGNLTEAEAGIYHMEGLLYGKYLLHEEQAPVGFVRDDGYYSFSITEDGKTVTMETKPGEGFRNKPIEGELELTKKDASDGKWLPDTGVEILDKDGNVIFQGRTDENGVVKFKLPYGEYFYREFDAPEGYLLDETAYPFSITKDGEIVKAVMTNERIPEAPPMGDTRRYVLAALLTATSGVSLLLPTIKRKKKNRT